MSLSQKPGLYSRAFAPLVLFLLGFGGLKAGVESLILHLSFSDGPGASRFADASGHGHNARCGTSIPCPEARMDHGFFRLSSTHREWLEVTHSEELNPGEAFTMSVWIRPGNAIWENGRPVKIGGGKVMGKTNARFDGGFVLGTDVKSQENLTYQLYPEIWDSSGKNHVFRAGEFRFGEWTHLAVTWKSGGYMIGYVNGKEVKRIKASPLPVGRNNNPFRIGIAPWDTNALAFGGGIDDVRLYREDLGSEEIRALFQSGRNSDSQIVVPPNPEPDSSDADNIQPPDPSGPQGPHMPDSEAPVPSNPE